MKKDNFRSVIIFLARKQDVISCVECVHKGYLHQKMNDFCFAFEEKVMPRSQDT